MRTLIVFSHPEPHPWSDYDETQRLKPGVVARSGVQSNPGAGQTFEAAAQDQARLRTD